MAEGFLLSDSDREVLRRLIKDAKEQHVNTQERFYSEDEPGDDTIFLISSDSSAPHSARVKIRGAPTLAVDATKYDAGACETRMGWSVAASPFIRMAVTGEGKVMRFDSTRVGSCSFSIFSSCHLLQDPSLDW